MHAHLLSVPHTSLTRAEAKPSGRSTPGACLGLRYSSHQHRGDQKLLEIQTTKQTTLEKGPRVWGLSAPWTLMCGGCESHVTPSWTCRKLSAPPPGDFEPGSPRTRVLPQQCEEETHAGAGEDQASPYSHW